MGPRAAARGNMGRMASSRPNFTLQWGREQLLAEIQRPHGAQRPRHQASMGPRAAARGNIPPEVTPGRRVRLQWGREQLLAEMGSKSQERWKPARFNGVARS